MRTGPPGGGDPRPTPAQNTAFAPRGKLQLAAFVKGGALPEVIALPGAVTPLGSPVVPVPPSTADVAAVSSAAASVAPPDAGAAPSDAGSTVPSTPPPPKSGCGCEMIDTSGANAAALFTAASTLALALHRRRKHRA